MSSKSQSIPTSDGLQEAEAAVRHLAEALSEPLQKNDLGRLARMHSFCQALATLPYPANTPQEAAAPLAGALVRLLEGVILAEIARPEAGLALVPQAVAALQQVLAGQTVEVRALIAQLQAAASGDQAAAAQPAALCAVGQTPPSANADAGNSFAPPPPLPADVSTNRPDSSPMVSAALETADAGAPIAVEPYISEPLAIDLSEQEHLQGFLDESREHLDAIEAALLAVEQNPTDTGKINDLFRPFHTIKGIAGFLNLRDINRLTHEVETILDLGRKSELRITPPMIDLIFAAIDTLNKQINEIRKFLAQPSGNVVPQPEAAGIIGRLRLAATGQLPDAEGGAGRRANGAEPRAGDNVAAASASAPVSQTAKPETAENPAVAADATANAATDGGKQVIDASIRVDTTKLDALIDAVGELVIAQTMVNLNERVRTDEKLSRNVTQVTKIVRDIQETAMGMRMVPIGPTFQKMRRLARDVARKAGKQVELAISGEETELDKNVIQQISDPLVHMVRNAADHGIEPPDARRAAGKPEAGQVALHACHQSGAVVIEIRDDGRGLDRDKILAKARERGLVNPDETLTDAQVFQLVMLPGFSTADKITDISGRGVGMDVVKRNIEALRGKIEIASEKGRGTTFTIRLPLTLAIIDGMLIRVGQERLIIPTILIDRSLRPEPRQIATVQKKGEMIQVRGQLIPLVQLGELFGYSGRIDPCQSLVIIAQCEQQKIGLVVDELIGQQQVVIKTLGERFKTVQGISGAAILGDGRVGLILEPTGLLALHSTRGGGFAGFAGGSGWPENGAGRAEQTPMETGGEAAREMIPTF